MRVVVRRLERLRRRGSPLPHLVQVVLPPIVLVRREHRQRLPRHRPHLRPLHSVSSLTQRHQPHGATEHVRLVLQDRLFLNPRVEQDERDQAGAQREERTGVEGDEIEEISKLLLRRRHHLLP